MLSRSLMSATKHTGEALISKQKKYFNIETVALFEGHIFIDVPTPIKSHFWHRHKAAGRSGFFLGFAASNRQCKQAKVNCGGLMR